MSRFQKVAFTMLPVRDAAIARAFYESTLGLGRGSASPDGNTLILHQLKKKG